MRKIIFMLFLILFILSISFFLIFYLFLNNVNYFNKNYNNSNYLNKKYTRIISLSPEITEIIFELKKENKLIGRTDYCNYPKESLKIQSIGTLLNPNIEKIIELKPDLVISSNYINKELYNTLKSLNIKIIYFHSYKKINDLFNNINIIGNLLDSNNKSIEIINKLKLKIYITKNKIKKFNKNFKYLNVYYMISFGREGDFTYGGDTFMNEIFNILNVNNIAKDIKGWRYSLESLIEKNPDIIIYGKKLINKNELFLLEGYKNLKAIKNNKLFEINDDIYSRLTPRIINKGLDELLNIFYNKYYIK